MNEDACLICGIALDSTRIIVNFWDPLGLSRPRQAGYICSSHTIKEIIAHETPEFYVDIAVDEET